MGEISKQVVVGTNGAREEQTARAAGKLPGGGSIHLVRDIILDVKRNAGTGGATTFCGRPH